MQVQVDALMSWILLSDGNEEDALHMAAAAADREDAVDKHPVTPGEVLPARELYADMLFETKNYAESLEQYGARRLFLRDRPGANPIRQQTAHWPGPGLAGLTLADQRYRSRLRTRRHFWLLRLCRGG